MLMVGTMSIHAQRVSFNGERMSLKKAFERIEPVSYTHLVDGVVDKNSITLTRKATKQLLCEFKQRYGGDGSSMVEHKAIAAKHLYYDKEVEAQVNRLTDLLSIKSFKQICRRLKQHGMRQGFACLFYGAPGTGKTETVLQLAKQTGRDICLLYTSHAGHPPLRQHRRGTGHQPRQSHQQGRHRQARPSEPHLV